MIVSTSFWMGPDENFLIHHNVSPWTLSMLLCISQNFSLKVILIRWVFRGDSKHFILNLLWWEIALRYFSYYLSCYRLSSCNETFISCFSGYFQFIGYWKIIMLCCLQCYVSLKCSISSCACLLIWSHYSQNTFI